MTLLLLFLKAVLYILVIEARAAVWEAPTMLPVLIRDALYSELGVIPLPYRALNKIKLNCGFLTMHHRPLSLVT
jgi:hypothetical protein